MPSTWWHHQMKTFSALLVLGAGNSSVIGESPPPPPPPPHTHTHTHTQRPVTRTLMFSLIYAWTNGCAKNRGEGDLRRNRAHYDVTVMNWKTIIIWNRPNEGDGYDSWLLLICHQPPDDTKIAPFNLWFKCQDGEDHDHRSYVSIAFAVRHSIIHSNEVP